MRARLVAPLRLAVMVLALGACDRGATGEGPLPNVRLGMTPRDVRERFEPGGAGTWQTRVGAGEDTALEWTSHDEAAKVPTARFEFHLGMLVAVRARVKEPAKAEHVETTARTVTWTKPSASGGSDVVSLARDCPTHKEESDALVSRAR
jgi:hypothetical protein